MFEGRVHGVVFGSNQGELLVLVAGRRPTAFRLSWRENRVLEQAPLGGSPGFQSIRAQDGSSRALIGYVGRTPASPGTPARSVVRIATLEGGTLRTVVDAMGSNAVGSPAIAGDADAAGRRIAVVPLTFDNKLAVVDLSSGTLLARVPTGIAPSARS